jgi:hypothetical protein
MSRPPPARPRILIEIRDEWPNADAGPFAVRVRRALKCILRSFGLRCLSIRPVADDKPATDEVAQDHPG